MLDSVEIPITTRITLPDVWVDRDTNGIPWVRAKQDNPAGPSFMEMLPAEPLDVGHMLGRLRDFLTRNAKVELLQG